MVRHTWRSCNKFGVTGIFFPCRQQASAHLLKEYRSHQHTTGLRSTAVLLQHSMIDLLTAIAHTPVGASTVDVNCPTATAPIIVALRLSAVHAPRSERTAVQASLARMIGDFSSRLFVPSATYLNLVNANFFLLAFSLRAVRVGDAFILLLRR